MKAAALMAAKAAGLYLVTNKKARALEWALVLGVGEAVRAAIWGA